jgi:hypothetical protein
MFTLAGGAISWRSCKQSIVASSTMYVEFIACLDAAGQAIWLKKFIPNLKVVDCIDKPLKIYCGLLPLFYLSKKRCTVTTSPQYSALTTTSRVKLLDQ